MNIIAIDAGGSKTRILILKKSDLTNEYYNNIKELTLGPCNYLTSGRQGIKKVVSEIINNFKITKTDQTSVFGGFAGAGSLHIKNDIKSIFFSVSFCTSPVLLVILDSVDSTSACTPSRVPLKTSHRIFLSINAFIRSFCFSGVFTIFWSSFLAKPRYGR